MEPINTLTATAISILVPYLAEVGKSFAKKAGEAAWAQCEAIYKAIRSKFQGRPAAEEVLADLEANPHDEDNQAAMRKELRKALENDKEFLDQLRQLISEAQQAGIVVTGSGAVATSGGTAAGAGGIAVHGDVKGGIHMGSSDKTRSDTSDNR